MGRLRMIITEEDKQELEELGYEAVEAVHKFLDCLDQKSDGQISDEMRRRYSERRGVPGTGRYGRRDDILNERRGVPGTGRYGRRDDDFNRRQNYRDDEMERERMERERMETRGGYGSRYEYDY